MLISCIFANHHTISSSSLPLLSQQLRILLRVLIEAILEPHGVLLGIFKHRVLQAVVNLPDII